MRTSELRKLEEARAALAPAKPSGRRRARVVARGWDPKTLRSEIEADFKDAGRRRA